MFTREDHDHLAAALQAMGRPGAAGLVWLLEEGVRHFSVDQDAWQQFATTGRNDDAAARELQRREAQAHLLLMRVRVANLESRMDALRATVAELSPTYQALRSRLFTLQKERQALVARLASAELPEQHHRVAVAPLPIRLWNWLMGRRE